MWAAILGVGLMETILDTYCESTSVSQKFFFPSSSLGAKVYVTYILSNSEHASCAHGPVLESGLYRFSRLIASVAGGLQFLAIEKHILL